MSFVDCFLPYFKLQLITRLPSAPLLFQLLFTKSSHRYQLLAPPPFSSVLTAPHPLCCVFLLSSLFIIQLVWFLFVYLFFLGWESVCPGGYAGLSQGWLWEYRMGTWCSPLVCISQAGLEPASGGAGSLLFSQCNVLRRSFVQAGGSGCRSFDSSWCFFLPGVAPAFQQDF
jgi:hypothetical protein